MTSPDDVDPLAPSRPAASFKDAPPGFYHEGIVLELPKLMQGRNFDTGDPDCWPNGDPKMAVVTPIRKTDGSEVTFWSVKPSSQFTALVNAQKAAGERIKVGGLLRVTYTHSIPNLRDPKKNDIKQYEARYTPPVSGDPLGDSNGTPAAPAAQPAAPAAPITPPPAVVAAQQAAAAVPAAAPVMTKEAAPEIPVALRMQIAAFIGAGMTDAQIAGVPSVIAAKVTAEQLAQLREQGPV